MWWCFRIIVDLNCIMNEIQIGVAFLGGLASFLAPCVLPLMPGFLAYLSGATINEAGQKRLPIFLHSLIFVLGFSVVFSLLGVLLQTVLSEVAYEAQTWLSRIGGAVIIFFGLYLTGLIQLGFFASEHKIKFKTDSNSKYLTSFLFGIAFAAGWTPCVGPVLAGILGLAVSDPSSTFVLLMAYTLGLGLPFLLMGIFTGEALRVIRKYQKVLNYFEVAFGVLLIVLGVLVFTESLSLIANFEFLTNILS